MVRPTATHHTLAMRSTSTAHGRGKVPLSIRPIKRERVYELVVQAIQKSLASRELRPGDRLPPERDLAAALGISRPSLREALRLLEVMGMIDRRPGGGTYARTPEPPRLLASSTPILPTQHAFLLETLELRAVLEPAIGRLAADRATAKDIVKLRKILARQRNRVRRHESALQEDAAFHRTIAAATHNSVILRAVDSLNQLLHEWRAIWVQGRPAHSVAAHEHILSAITNHDGAAAESALKAHISEVETAVRQSLKTADSRPRAKSAIGRRRVTQARSRTASHVAVRRRTGTP